MAIAQSDWSLTCAYDKHLFKKATLQALPQNPRCVINASNLPSGALWQFSAPYMWGRGRNGGAPPTA